MTTLPRGDWSRHIDQVIRSKHYTWIAEGFAGASVETALVSITTDLMHMCRRAGLRWEDLVAQSQRLCDNEESEVRRTTNAA
jgi:hypothetical protein